MNAYVGALRNPEVQVEVGAAALAAAASLLVLNVALSLRGDVQQVLGDINAVRSDVNQVLGFFHI